MSAPPNRCDVAIVGAGPAGSVLARELALRGRSVVLIERATFPRRKVCGACLSGHAVRELTAAGLDGLLEQSGAIPQTGFRLGVEAKDRAPRAAFVQTVGGFALSRSRFDAALADAAVAAGAVVLYGAGATLGSDRTLTLKGAHAGTLRAGAVALACGLPGAGRGFESLASAVRPGSRVGAGCELARGAFDAAFFGPGTIHMAVAAGGYVGATVTEGGELNLAGAYDLAFLKECGGPGAASAAIFQAAGFPVAKGMADADWTGTPPLTRTAGDVAADGVFLVGDAAGYVEPFTGEGMGWALASARAAADPIDALLNGDAAAEAQWRRIYQRRVGRRKGWCRAVAVAARTPLAATVAAAALNRAPGLARPLVRHLAG
ncbi:NAD(P)/FAD-dependent oxidoreductase [Alienimonas californiensis]|uniref:Oxidoreductase n=1 Tax=Alienimonas californiensis TaxID=2527989 RepID=A0A517PFK4_9PLAN|nr:FAD-dependent oxidoreductase [Alienimonas californiensis]QDT18162.1 Putative oxidoreductase [Alienimonas californiensis]